MLALDFKLTSAQVKALLLMWHDDAAWPISAHWDSGRAAEAELFHTPQHSTVVGRLIEKGLVRREPYSGPPYTREVLLVRITPSGSALAEHIVGEAHKILALDASRRALAMRPKRAAARAKR